jgi:hypothetical protein
VKPGQNLKKFGGECFFRAATAQIRCPGRPGGYFPGFRICAFTRALMIDFAEGVWVMAISAPASSCPRNRTSTLHTTNHPDLMDAFTQRAQQAFFPADNEQRKNRPLLSGISGVFNAI